MTDSKKRGRKGGRKRKVSNTMKDKQSINSPKAKKQRRSMGKGDSISDELKLFEEVPLVNSNTVEKMDIDIIPPIHDDITTKATNISSSDRCSKKKSPVDAIKYLLSEDHKIVENLNGKRKMKKKSNVTSDKDRKKSTDNNIPSTNTDIVDHTMVSPKDNIPIQTKQPTSLFETTQEIDRQSNSSVNSIRNDIRTFTPVGSGTRENVLVGHSDANNTGHFGDELSQDNNYQGRYDGDPSKCFGLPMLAGGDFQNNQMCYPPHAFTGSYEGSTRLQCDNSGLSPSSPNQVGAHHSPLSPRYRRPKNKSPRGKTTRFRGVMKFDRHGNPVTFDMVNNDPPSSPMMHITGPLPLQFMTPASMDPIYAIPPVKESYGTENQVAVEEEPSDETVEEDPEDREAREKGQSRNIIRSILEEMMEDVFEIGAYVTSQRDQAAMQSMSADHRLQMNYHRNGYDMNMHMYQGYHGYPPPASREHAMYQQRHPHAFYPGYPVQPVYASPYGYQMRAEFPYHDYGAAHQQHHAPFNFNHHQHQYPPQQQQLRLRWQSNPSLQSQQPQIRHLRSPNLALQDPQNRQYNHPQQLLQQGRRPSPDGNLSAPPPAILQEEPETYQNNIPSPRHFEPIGESLSMLSHSPNARSAGSLHENPTGEFIINEKGDNAEKTEVLKGKEVEVIRTCMFPDIIVTTNESDVSDIPLTIDESNGAVNVKSEDLEKNDECQQNISSLREYKPNSENIAEYHAINMELKGSGIIEKIPEVGKNTDICEPANTLKSKLSELYIPGKKELMEIKRKNKRKAKKEMAEAAKKSLAEKATEVDETSAEVDRQTAEFVRRSVADTVVCVAKYDNCDKFNLAETNMHYIIGKVEGVDQKIDIFMPLFNEPALEVYCESGEEMRTKEDETKLVAEELVVGHMDPIAEEVAMTEDTNNNQEYLNQNKLMMDHSYFHVSSKFDNKPEECSYDTDDEKCF